MKTKRILVDSIIYIILFIVLLITILPLIYTILGSFKSNMEIMVHPEALFPLEWTMDNYKEIATSRTMNIPRMFMNSLYYTIVCTLICLAMAAVTGYVFARADFPGSKVIFAIFTATMFISVGGTTVVPMLRIMNFFHLGNSLDGLIIKNLFGIGIVRIYLVRGFVRQLPKEMDEAAVIDGCGFIGTFVKIILPNLKPIIATLAILCFKGFWNEYYLPTIFTVSRPEQQTLMVGLQRLKDTGGAAANWNLMLTGATISMFPILVVYAICNKYFVDGITAGAVKG